MIIFLVLAPATLSRDIAVSANCWFADLLIADAWPWQKVEGLLRLIRTRDLSVPGARNTSHNPLSQARKGSKPEHDVIQQCAKTVHCSIWTINPLKYCILVDIVSPIETPNDTKRLCWLHQYLETNQTNCDIYVIWRLTNKQSPRESPIESPCQTKKLSWYFMLSEW